MREGRARLGEADWHVMNRGARRLDIFKTPADRSAFLSMLGRYAADHHAKVLGYRLRPNHFHLLLRATGRDLGRVMHSLTFQYARHFNRTHGFKGHLFEHAYFSHPQRHAVRVAWLVRHLQSPGYLGRADAAGIVDPRPVLDACPELRAFEKSGDFALVRGRAQPIKGGPVYKNRMLKAFPELKPLAEAEIREVHAWILKAIGGRRFGKLGRKLEPASIAISLTRAAVPWAPPTIAKVLGTSAPAIAMAEFRLRRRQKQDDELDAFLKAVERKLGLA